MKKVITSGPVLCGAIVSCTGAHPGTSGVQVNHNLSVQSEALTTRSSYEPPRGKTNNVVSEQVRHKPACISTEKS